MEQAQHWRLFGLLDPSSCDNSVWLQLLGPLSVQGSVLVFHRAAGQVAFWISTVLRQKPKQAEPNPALHLSERGAERGTTGRCCVLVRHGDI